MIKILLTFFCLTITTLISGQNIGINNDGSSPATGAILDVKSSSKGILIPRTTIASITSPTEGMMIYDTNNNRMMLYTGSSWYELMTEADEGPFERDVTTIRQKGDYDTDDFLFGSPTTTVATTIPYQSIMYYDKSTGALRGGLYESIGKLSSLGTNSISFGYNNVASGPNSVSFGQSNSANGSGSFAVGSSSYANGASSFAGGYISMADGFASFSMGKNVTAHSAFEVTLGIYSPSYTPSSSINWVGTDRIFSIGNGFSLANTSNALTILKNGKSGFGTTSPNAWLHIDADLGEDLLRLDEDGSLKLEFKTNPQGDLLYHLSSSNTLLGFEAGQDLTSGINNVMVGKKAGLEATGGQYNVFIGEETGRGSDGDNNTFLGYGAGANSSGNRNVFIGETVGLQASASDRLYIGNSTSDDFIYGEFDNKILKINGGLRASEGFEDDDGDTKIQVEENNDDDIIRFDIEGSEKLKFIQNSNDRVRIEFLSNNDNTLIGLNAGQSIGNSGAKNTVLGSHAGEDIITGDFNTVVGNLAGASINLGQYNTMLGASSGENNFGGNNTFIGTGAGFSSGSASGNVCIGSSAGANETVSNRLYIDNSDTSEPLIYGQFNTNELEINGDLSIDNHSGSGESTSELRFKDVGTTEYSFRHYTTSNPADNYFYLREDRTSTNIAYAEDGNFGIKRHPTTNDLEVNGTASKSTAGDWLANSDARLKKNIKSLTPEEILDKMTSLQGITYEWDDNRPDTGRPDGVQYGFTAQNIQEIFPTLVSEDADGYLQTAYGTYDAMYVESIKALLSKIQKLENENQYKTKQVRNLQEQLDKTHQSLGQICQRLTALEINN